MSTKEDGLSSTLINVAYDPLNTQELIRLAGACNAATVSSDSFDSFEDQFSAHRHHRVVNGKNTEYRAWIESEVARLKKNRKVSGFLSLVTINTTSDFLHTFRFRDYRSLLSWLVSNEHQEWGRRAEGLCEELGHDVSQGGVSFLPTSMSPVAKRILKVQTKPKIAMSNTEKTTNQDAYVHVKRQSSSKRCAPFQLCGQGDQCCGQKFAIQGPEPEWRKAVVIFLAGCSMFVPYAFLLLGYIYGPFLPDRHNPFAFLGVKGQDEWQAPTDCVMKIINNTASFTPGECGSPRIENNIFFWGFLFTNFIVNAFMVWFAVPLWSIVCRPFTHCMPKFAQCGCNFEPFTTMDDGLPCFRPRKQQWEYLLEESNNRLKNMEKLLAAEAHLRRSIHNRFKTRLSKLEGSKGINASSTRMQTDSIQSKVRKRVNAEIDAFQKKGGDGLDSDSLVCIRTWVQQDNFGPADNMLHDTAYAMHVGAAGFKGMVVITPENSGAMLVKQTGPEGISSTAPYDIFYEFETFDHLKAWIASETRTNFLALGDNLFRGPPEGGMPVLHVEVHDALSSLFISGAKQARQLASLSKVGRAKQSEVLQYHPQTWKIWWVLNVAFGVVGLPIIDLWLNRAPSATWVPGPIFMLDPVGVPTVGKIMIFMVICVPIIVFISIPIVLSLVKGWVFEPWHLSSNPLIAVLQEGFPCCLATGPRNEAQNGDDDDNDDIELKTM